MGKAKKTKSTIETVDTTLLTQINKKHIAIGRQRAKQLRTDINWLRDQQRHLATEKANDVYYTLEDFAADIHELKRQIRLKEDELNKIQQDHTDRKAVSRIITKMKNKEGKSRKTWEELGILQNLLEEIGKLGKR